MPIFKNENEVAYVGGRKHWTDVIKNSGSGELLIWRQPEEDFNINSTLIVMPGEEAIFIKGGNIEQIFESGTYRLSTENYPFISRLRNAFSGGVSTFSCVVYFVRKAISQEIYWGTSSPISVRDKKWNIVTNAKVRGSYKVRIDNARLFLEKLIGNNIRLRTQADLDGYFVCEFQGKIKSAVSSFLNDLQQELIGLDAYLDELSNRIEPYVASILGEYGLKCVRFALSGLDIDVSKYNALDESRIAAITKRTLAEGDKMVIEALQDNWGRQKAAEILSDLARNPGAGSAGAAGAGIGMGVAAGNVFGNMASHMFEPINNTYTRPQHPEQPVVSGRFTIKGGNVSDQSQVQDPTSATDPIEVLSKLKKMLDLALISQEQYDEKVKEIMSRI